MPQKKQCPSCGKEIALNNFSVHVRRVHPDRMKQLCPRATDGAQEPPHVDPHPLLDEDEILISGQRSPVMNLDVSSSSDGEEASPAQRHVGALPRLYFVDRAGNEPAVNWRCGDTSSPCNVNSDGFTTRILVTNHGSGKVRIQRFKCTTHGKYFRTLNPQAIADARRLQWRLNHECIQYKRTLYDVGFLTLLATLFIISGSITVVARTVAVTHNVEEVGSPETNPDPESDDDEAEDEDNSIDDRAEDVSEDQKRLDATVSALKRTISPLLVALFKAVGVPTALDKDGILPSHVKEISIDFTYSAATKIRLPLSDQPHSKYVGINANIGTLLSAKKICLGTILCPKGEGRSQVDRLIDKCGIHDPVETVSVDNVPMMRDTLTKKFGDQVNICGDRFHAYRILTHGMKIKNPDRGKLMRSLRNISTLILTKEIQTVPQLRQAFVNILDSFATERTTTALHVPRGSKITPTLCRGLMNASTNAAAKRQLEHHGALELFPPLINGELTEKWKKFIADDAAIAAVLGNPASFLAQGTNVNENFHSFMNQRLRSYRRCGYELFVLALRITQEIYNVRAIHNKADPVTYIARRFKQKFCQEMNFWDRFEQTSITQKQMTLEELGRGEDAKFAVISSQPWSQQEHDDLERLIGVLNLEALTPNSSLAEIVSTDSKFRMRSIGDISRRIGMLLTAKMRSLSGVEQERDELPPAGAKRARSATPVRSRTLRDRVLDAIRGIPCEHLPPGAPQPVPPAQLAIVTVKSGRVKSTGIGIVLECVDGIPSSVEYYMVDNKAVEAGSALVALVPPINHTLVNVMPLNKQIPLR